MTKIHFIAMWSDFDINNNNIINLGENIIISDIDNSDILIVGSFITQNDINIIMNYKKKKYLYITEPIGWFYPMTFELFKNNIFDIVFGCIEDNINCIKFPIYNLIKYKETFSDINNYVKKTNILEKNKCCMIFSHDHGNTRKPIYNELIKFINIDCPGKLLNNCSNEELNKMGNAEYIKKYIFNICPENFICNFNGYITEKLMNCCMGGAIPIYCGYFDEIDGMIFNKDRIIFFNKDNVKDCIDKILTLMNNKQLLISFYQQDIFMPTADVIINTMNLKLKSKL